MPDTNIFTGVAPFEMFLPHGNDQRFNSATTEKGSDKSVPNGPISFKD